MEVHKVKLSDCSAIYQKYVTKIRKYSHKNVFTVTQICKTYWELHRWSIDNYPAFWEEVWNFVNIIYAEPYTEVVEKNKKFEEIPKWFLGARLNYTENILKHPKEDVALILIGEEKMVPEIVTYGQLRDEVALLSSALRRKGIKQGDAVACFSSNRKEAVISMLAAACIGTIFLFIDPYLGVESVLQRLQQINPKVLFTVDRHVKGGKEKDVVSMLPDLVQRLRSLEYLVIATSVENSLTEDVDFIPKSLFYSDFLKFGLMPDGSLPHLQYNYHSFSHPFLVSFTSGTTGIPKAFVHSIGASLIAPMKDLILHINMKKSDVLFNLSQIGMVLWNFFLASLCIGASVVIFEGDALHSKSYTFWDLIDRYGVTIAFIVPLELELMEKKQMFPGPHNELKSLHTLLTGTCRINPKTYDFVYKKVKPNIFFSSLYGATELNSAFGGINHNMPVYKDEVQVLSLGSDVRCYDENGERLVNKVGELVIGTPFPSMPLFIWNDIDKKQYGKLFFRKYPGVWRHGDHCIFNSKTGGLTVTGRSDDTIIQQGIRFGSSEIYFVVNAMNEVVDSLCVSMVKDNGNAVAVLFVKMNDGYFYTLDTMCLIQKNIALELGAEFVPKLIFPVKDIPYNLSHKRIETLIKKMLSGFKDYSRDTIMNPDCLSEYENFVSSLENFKD